MKKDHITISIPHYTADAIEKYVNKDFVIKQLAYNSSLEPEIAKELYPLYFSDERFKYETKVLIDEFKNIFFRFLSRDYKKKIIEVTDSPKYGTPFKIPDEYGDCSSLACSQVSLDLTGIVWTFNTANVKRINKEFGLKVTSKDLNVYGDKFNGESYLTAVIFFSNDADVEKTKEIFNELNSFNKDFDFAEYFSKEMYLKEEVEDEFERFYDTDGIDTMLTNEVGEDYFDLYRKLIFQRDEYIKVQSKGESEERQKYIREYAENGFKNAMKDLAKDFINALYKWKNNNN